MSGESRPDRLWLGGGVLASVLLLAIAWFVVISPELTATDELGEQTAAAQTQNTVAQSKVGALRADFSRLDELTAQLRRARSGLPVDSGLPSFTRQLTERAAAAGVVLTSITTAAPALATPVNPAPAAAADAAAPAGETPSAGTATPASGTRAPGATLLSIPVTVVVEGDLAGNRAWLNAVQGIGPRRTLITSVVLAPGGGAPTTASIATGATMTVQLKVFVSPMSPDEQAALRGGK